MDWDTIELNWDRYKKLAREKWHRIPDTAFESLGGSRDRLIEAIEQAYDMSNEQAQREVNYWSREAPRMVEAMAQHVANSRARAAAEIRALATETSTRIGEGRQRLASLREQAGARSGGAIEQVSRRVQAHPAVTLAIALGVGMLLGQLIMRRR